MGPIFVSFANSVTVPNVGVVAPEDIVRYDAGADTWSPWFDGSDVGITADVNAVHVRADGHILMSFATSTVVPGLQGGPSNELVNHADIVRFDPSSIGATTAGSFHFHFDGSDVGIAGVGDNITGLAELPGGDLAFALAGGTGTSAGKVGAPDAILFQPLTLGAQTSGSYSTLFDVSDPQVGVVSFSGLAFDGGELLYAGSNPLAGVNPDEISRFVGTLRSHTSGVTLPVLDLGALGVIGSAVIDAISHVE